MADGHPEERDTSLALRAAHGNRLRTAVKWYRDNGRLHSGDPIAMAADALDAYLTDRDAGKDALLICDTWEMADALTVGSMTLLPPHGPTLRSRATSRSVSGDIVMSRSNDTTIAVHPGAGCRPPASIRSATAIGGALPQSTQRPIALPPNAYPTAPRGIRQRVLQEHVTLGYAATVHSAQGVTADSCYAILGEGASRAMLYVAMTRGRHNNEAFLYQRLTNEADHEHSKPLSGDGVHIARRGNKYSAAHHFRMILAKDDRPRTVHAEAERTERHLLPEIVSDLLQRHDERRRARRAAGRRTSGPRSGGVSCTNGWPERQQFGPRTQFSMPPHWRCRLSSIQLSRITPDLEEVCS